MKLYPKGKHITCFKEGDLLRRTVPIKDKIVKGGFDDSYMEVSILFEGIINDKIWYKWWKGNQFSNSYTIDLNKWGNNWIKVDKL